MSDLDFGTLMDVKPRDAWPDEARNFTPWLAANLERLGTVIGLELELLGSEAALPTRDDNFSADIIARDLRSDATVLIENQLERSDHTHLGQILTYLAGLEARTVIWVAPHFREAHLAAVRWLNQHTTDEFAFFAIRLRVVRIGESSMAPLFDVLERPNTWERNLQSVTRAAKATSEVGMARKAFWEAFFATYPADGAGDGIIGGHSTQWRRCNGGLVISYYIAKAEVGLFVRGDSKVSIETVIGLLAPNGNDIEAKLGVSIGSRAGNFGVLADRCAGDYTDPSQRTHLASWLHKRVSAYEAALNAAFTEDE